MGAAKALWLAPSEWLIVGSAAERSAVVAAGAGARAVHLADVTDGRVVYVVSGPRSADLLAKGCTLDFHDRAFPIGACAQSALAQVFAIVERTADTQFHVYADTSLAHHLELWFVDALKEFELRNLN
jgi:sarcosine oxidase subunit gamma